MDSVQNLPTNEELRAAEPLQQCSPIIQAIPSEPVSFYHRPLVRLPPCLHGTANGFGATEARMFINSFSLPYSVTKGGRRNG